MKTTEDLFGDDGDWGSLHDVLIELHGKRRTKDEVKAMFLLLPEHVRDEAHTWGLSDTVFGDDAYVYFRDKAPHHLSRKPTP